jgi:hypothetical protein
MLNAMQRRMDELQREMRARIDEVHRSYKRELVRWEPPAGDGRTVKIQVERPTDKRPNAS